MSKQTGLFLESLWMPSFWLIPTHWKLINYPEASGKDPASLKIAPNFEPIRRFDKELKLEMSASLPLRGGNLTPLYSCLRPSISDSLSQQQLI